MANKFSKLFYFTYFINILHSPFDLSLPCKLCKLVYEDDAEKKLRKENLPRAEFLSCGYEADKKKCEYWVQAICENITTHDPKEAGKISFFCPLHSLNEDKSSLGQKR